MEHQKSAFLIQIAFKQQTMEGKKLVTSYDHDHPLIILKDVPQAIDFMSRYTDFAKFENNDIHQMRQSLKRTVCWYDITDWERLKNEILHEDTFGVTTLMYGFTNVHLLGIHRLPLGIYKLNLKADFY